MLKTYGLGRYALNDAVGAAANSTFADDSQFSGRRGDSVEAGCDVNFRQNTATDQTGTYSYDRGRVSKRATYGAGVITLDPAPVMGETTFDNTLNYSEALVLDLPLRWEDADNYMNAALTELIWEKRIVPVTLVTDGDMVLAGVTNWTVGQGAETVTKSAGAFSVPRYLSVVGSTSSQYVRSASIGTEQGKSYYYEVCAFKTAANDGSIQLYDVTNASGTSLVLANDDIDERVPKILANNVSLASTTEQVQTRLLKSDTGTTQGIGVLWVILRRNDARVFTIQDRPAKLLWLGELRATNETNYVARSWENMWPVAAKTIQRDAGIWDYHLQQSVSGLSVWYEEFVQPVVMTADSDTSAIEMEALAAVTAEKLLAPLQDTAIWARRYEKARDAAFAAKANRMAALRTTRQEAQYVLSPLGV